jgi:precorrin-2 dehydrogenase/sirohydrochlorin ferrochelatase
VFVALDDPAERALAADVARASGALVNLVDQPDGSDFITPAIIDRGAVVAGITTSGSAPVLASRLRQELEALWPRGLGLLARLLRDTQSQIRRALPDPVQRRAFMRHALDGEFASLALEGDEVSARQALERALYEGHGRQTGRVERMVVPDSAEHLTLSQLRVLGSADRLLLVGPIPASVLAFARRDAPRQLWSKDQDDLSLQAWLEAGEVVLELHSA